MSWVTNPIGTLEKKFGKKAVEKVRTAIEIEVQKAETQGGAGKRERVVTVVTDWLKLHGINIPGWVVNFLIELAVLGLKAMLTDAPEATPEKK